MKKPTKFVTTTAGSHGSLRTVRCSNNPPTPGVISVGPSHPLSNRAAAMKEARPLHRPPPFRPLPRHEKP
jgi:hypothetical protein